MEVETIEAPIQVKAASAPRIVKQTFVEACINSTAHALPNVFRSDSIILKIIWLILFLCGVGGCVYCNL